VRAEFEVAYFFRTSSPIEIPNELIIAATSHQAVIRHQNQRSKYSSPVPAPTWSMMSKLSLADSRRYTVPAEHRNRPIVVSRPTPT